ncbi:MAG: hypothetical protein WBV23_12120 [Desulfobaccales bacterium]
MKSTKKERLAYHPPQVMDYGNVKQITMATGRNGNTDTGGWTGHNKTAA